MTFSDWLNSFVVNVQTFFAPRANAPIAQAPRNVQVTKPAYVKPVKTSPSGVQFIAQFESFQPRAYRDAAGYWTIGYGHKIVFGDGLSTKSVLTTQQAHALLQRDLMTAENAVLRYVRVPLTQKQFDALVSFVFNVGAGNFAQSTLLRLLNSGLFQNAADEFVKWVNAGGKKLAGLVQRRYAERQQFLG